MRCLCVCVCVLGLGETESNADCIQRRILPILIGISAGRERGGGGRKTRDCTGGGVCNCTAPAKQRQKMIG